MSKLYRSRRDKKVTGLCGGLAEMLNVDATLLRLLVVITTFFSGGTVIFIYIIASLVIPKEPGFDPPLGGPYRDPFAPGAGFGGHHGHGHHGHHNHHNHHSPFGHQGHYGQPHAEDKKSGIDEMMKDIERKAMQREIEELKAKLAAMETNKTKGDV
jgi:phage shock protein PspC (stress-responsive transcriptional regulator)